MEHLLFAGYLVLFSWLITRIKFFTNSGLTNSQLIILFLLKVMAGIFYGWIGVWYWQMAQMIDTWAYHVESIAEYKFLLKHPIDFATSLFQNHYAEGFGNFLTTHNSWWNDIKANFLIKLLAVFNVFSFGHYYVNVIFICFLTFFGPMAIYRIMKDIFPSRQLQVILATFVIPSFLYWTSGLHKEGLIFTGLAMVIYHFYFTLKEKRFSARRIFPILVGLFLVLILRNFLIIILLPSLITWYIAEKRGRQQYQVFALSAVICIIVFFATHYITPKFDLPKATADRQEEFLKLGGGSAVEVRKLEPTPSSFLQNAPQSLALSLLRPYPGDVRHLLSLAAATEIGVILLLFFAFLVWRKKTNHQPSFLLFCVFFSFGVLLMVGYTVNILGAVVRYRSIIFPFLIVPMIARINWQRINALISGNIQTKSNV